MGVSIDFALIETTTVVGPSNPLSLFPSVYQVGYWKGTTK